MADDSTERWRILSPILIEATKVPLERRAAFLETACGGDAALMADASRLLDYADRMHDILERPPHVRAEDSLRRAYEEIFGGLAEGSSDPAANALTITTASAPDPLAERFGPYRLLQRIGEGGMGEIYLAEQTEPIHRQVALKVIKAGLDTKQVVARFEAERQALALMDHPGIAKVFDAGETPRGLPYFAMEYVKGEPINAYCDRHRLDTPQRLDLFARVCDAVQHAHQKGIIHRDLKPSNVLVSIVGAQPQPKVIDFGVAKATSQRLTEKTMFTELGVLLGTPEYMSPEQAEMTGLDVDTRTDVYALGVMLYELLTGELPFESKELRALGYDGIRRRIREVDPPRPSTRVRTLGARSGEAAKCRRTDPGRLVSRLRGDLDWIVMKALEKDRTRRYGTPGELAADLARHLRHEPVSAGPPGAAYRSRKFVRRHRFGVAAAGLGVAGLAAFGIGMALQARTIARERDRAERVSDFLVEVFSVSDPSEARGNTITAREVLDRGAQKIEKELGSEPLVQAQMMATMGMVYRNLGLATRAEPLLAGAVALRSRLLGQDHPGTLEAQGRLAIVFEREGRYREAEKLLGEVLATQRRVLGPDHPETLWTQHQQAYVVDRLGRFAEAETIYRETYEARRRVLGDDHRDTLLSLSGLAVSLERQGRYDESGTLARKVLEARRRVLGEDHPDAIWSLQNVASVLDKQGKYGEAEKLYGQAYELMKRVQGEEHPDTLWIKSNLAGVIYYQSRFTEAESLFREVLEARRKVLGPEHPQTLAAWTNLASVLSSQGPNPEAEGIYKQVLAIRMRVQGPEHPSTINTMGVLAAEYAERKRYQEAERLLREVVDKGRRILGPTHPDTLQNSANLASVLADMGRLPEAEKLCRETLEQQHMSVGAEHPDALWSTVLLASIEVRQGRRQAGLDLFRQAVESGFADPDTIRKDEGLKTLADDPEFKRLVAVVAKRTEN